MLPKHYRLQWVNKTYNLLSTDWVHEKRAVYYKNEMEPTNADKSLTRPGRKQANVSVRMA